MFAFSVGEGLGTPNVLCNTKNRYESQYEYAVGDSLMRSGELMYQILFGLDDTGELIRCWAELFIGNNLEPT